MMKKNTDERLDQGWVELIFYAKKMGLTIEEIQLFLSGNSYCNNYSNSYCNNDNYQINVEGMNNDALPKT